MPDNAIGLIETKGYVETATSIGELISVHVIPRPHPELARHFKISGD